MTFTDQIFLLSKSEPPKARREKRSATIIMGEQSGAFAGERRLFHLLSLERMKKRQLHIAVRFLFMLLRNAVPIETFVLRAMTRGLPTSFHRDEHHPLFVSQRDGTFNSESRLEINTLLKNVQDILDKRQSTTSFDRRDILSQLDKRHAADCDAARVLAVEEDDSGEPFSLPVYMWVHVQNHPLAVQSLAPIMTASDIATLVCAAEQYWQQSDSVESRFTYQRVGNSEAHVSDLGKDAVLAMDRVLKEAVYPLVRAAFCTNDDDSRLCVYDALIIRYNATEANNLGAGQPLHRDLGIVSVNIMLNGEEEFNGGGTFFENQLRHDESHVVPLKPLGKGHCLAHHSAERHAGAATVNGVRDILVIFVTAQQVTSTPKLIQNARLKQSARRYCEEQCDDTTESIICRIQHQLMAIEAVPEDGEAFQYLGTALMEYAEQVNNDNDEGGAILKAAVECFRHAALLTPCDSRVYSNLGLTLSRQDTNIVHKDIVSAPSRSHGRYLSDHKRLDATLRTNGMR